MVFGFLHLKRKISASLHLMVKLKGYETYAAVPEST